MSTLIETVAQAKELLDRIDEIQAKSDFLGLQRQQQIDAILTDEQIKTIAAIEAKFKADVEPLNTKIDNLKSKLKPFILKYGDTIQGEYYQGIFRRGYMKYKTKDLEAFIEKLAEEQPELAEQISALKEKTADSVTFKAVAR